MDGNTVLVCSVLMGAAFVQAALGFGFALVAMTMLVLVHDVTHAAAVVNIAGSALIVSMSISLRHAIAWPYVRRIVPWAVVGVVAGVSILSALDRVLAVRLLGASILAIAGWNLFAPSQTSTPNRASDAAAGLASGLLTGAFNQGGPPLIAHLYRRPYEPETLKGTAQLIFLVTGLIRLPTAAAHGHLTAAVWWQALAGLPFVAVGLVAGLSSARHLDADRFRRLSWIALSLLGLYLVLHP